MDLYLLIKEETIHLYLMLLLEYIGKCTRIYGSIELLQIKNKFFSSFD